jgi:hypothetical protein
MLKYHIQTIEVPSGGVASINFNSIPQIYDDLLLVYSVRSSGLSQGRQVNCRFNGSAANFTSRSLYSPSNGTPTSYSTTESAVGMYSGSADTGNSFSSQNLLISNYRAAAAKPFSVDGVYGNNGQAYVSIIAGLWNDVSAISQISLFNPDGTNVWTQFSSASLYGIKRGADGKTEVASGGTITTSGGFTIHTFNTSGTFVANRDLSAEVLVVAGGGSGGSTTSLVDYNTGAGGAGGYRALSATSISSGSYPIVIGAGGSVGGVGTPGSNSSALGIQSSGGGAGGAGGGGSVPATSGGSGGGGGTPNNLTGAAGNAGGYSTAEGFAGGNGNSGGAGSTSGGGGGAGGAGGTPTAGPGVANGISGSSVTYATGGTGLSGGGTGSASNAAANTGNGGNAGRSQRFVAGFGGSGVVIIRYLTPA